MKSPAVVAATARLFKGGGVRRFPHRAGDPQRQRMPLRAESESVSMLPRPNRRRRRLGRAGDDG